MGHRNRGDDDGADEGRGESFVKSYLSDLKLPKDLLSLFAQTALKSKDEITQRIIKELSAVAKKVDFGKEFSKFAQEHRFKISAEIEVIRKDKKKE